MKEMLESWTEGVAHFNEHRFWHAHEAWERGWTKLPRERKLHIQALIQAAAVFHLIGIGRPGPARRLAKRALEKFAQAPAFFSRIEVPGLEPILEKIAVEGEGRSPDLPIDLPTGLKDLRAELLLSPRS